MNFVDTRPSILMGICTICLLAGCASTPQVPDPPLEHGSLIGIRIASGAAIRIFDDQTPEKIYFVRLENENLLGEEIITSNFRRDNRLYLLNASPGTYVAVASSKMGPPALQYGSPIRNTIYFPRDLVEKTRVKVGLDEFVFMGDFDVLISPGWSGGDDVQSHYRNIIAPGAEAKGFLKGMLQSLSGDIGFWGSLRKVSNDDQARSDFLLKSREDMAGSGWATRLERPVSK